MSCLCMAYSQTAPAGLKPRLQAEGLNVTSVQNPLSTLPDAVDAARKVLDRQEGPTVLAGHSFSGVIVSEAGVHSNVSALAHVAARSERVQRFPIERDGQRACITR